jgi:hypothetical protein
MISIKLGTGFDEGGGWGGGWRGGHGGGTEPTSQERLRSSMEELMLAGIMPGADRSITDGRCLSSIDSSV